MTDRRLDPSLWPPFLTRHEKALKSRSATSGTHALVLGVSSYPNLAPTNEFGLASLNSAASGALAFAHWLNNDYANASGAPLASLRVLLSPSDSEVALNPDAFKVLRATNDNVDAAAAGWLEDCYSQPGSIAVLYCAGHGLILNTTRYGGDPEEDSLLIPHLLLEDFWAARSFRNTFLTSLFHIALSSLRDGQSWIFHDCCQVVTPRSILVPQGVTPMQPPESVTGVRVFGGAYYATSPKGRAYGYPGKQTTAFAEALLEALNGAGAEGAANSPEGGWAVTNHSLTSAMEVLIKAQQRPGQLFSRSVTGRGDPAFHRLPGPPASVLQVNLVPDDTASATAGSVIGDSYRKDFSPGDFPWNLDTVPAGLHTIVLRHAQAEQFVPPSPHAFPAHPLRPYVKTFQGPRVNP